MRERIWEWIEMGSEKITSCDECARSHGSDWACQGKDSKQRCLQDESIETMRHGVRILADSSGL